MPYCRRCGAKLEDYARFCHNCGTQIISYVAPAQPVVPKKPWYKDIWIVTTVVLVAILISAAIVVVLAVAPFSSWNISRSLEDDTPNVNTVNLNFETNIGRVDISTLKISDNNIGIYVEAGGSKGLFGGTDIPVSISFENQTSGDVLTIYSKVIVENEFSDRSNVICQIYVSPDLFLNLNVTSETGQVSFNGDETTNIESLCLQTTTGNVQAHLQGNVTFGGNISLKTVTGTVHHRMSETNIIDNCTLNLQSTTGSIYLDIIQTIAIQGSVKVVTNTSTGSINLGLEIDNSVGAKITSQINGIGNIYTDVNHFSGNKSPIQSNNYPSTNNIEINNAIKDFGDIKIQATYKSAITPILLN